MPLSSSDAVLVTQAFQAEYKGLAHVPVVLLENTDDFKAYYGANADRAIKAWEGKLAAYDRPTGTIVVSLAAHHAPGELAQSLRHEGIGHHGVNTFDAGAKRAVLDAIIGARGQPGELSWLWRFIETAYPDACRHEQAEELFALACESSGKRPDRADKFPAAWKEVIEDRARPLKKADLDAIADHVAHGLRENTRTQKIFPLSNNDQFRSAQSTARPVDAERQAKQLLGNHGAQVRAASSSGVYVGAIVGETPTHWIQRLSPSTAILHDKAAVSGVAIGQAGTLRYRQGQAQLTSGHLPQKSRGLSR